MYNVEETFTAVPKSENCEQLVGKRIVFWWKIKMSSKNSNRKESVDGLSKMGRNRGCDFRIWLTLSCVRDHVGQV